MCAKIESPSLTGQTQHATRQVSPMWKQERIQGCVHVSNSRSLQRQAVLWITGSFLNSDSLATMYMKSLWKTDQVQYNSFYILYHRYYFTSITCLWKIQASLWKCSIRGMKTCWSVAFPSMWISTEYSLNFPSFPYWILPVVSLHLPQASRVQWFP